MRDCFELLDLIAYMIGIGLILPVLATAGHESSWATGLLVLLVLPFPLYLARFRFTFPLFMESVLERFAYLVLFGGLLVLVVGLGIAGYRWLSA